MLRQYYTIIGCRYEANEMETQYWANVAWQENDNDNNIAKGKPTLSQYIYVVWDTSFACDEFLQKVLSP